MSSPTPTQPNVIASTLRSMPTILVVEDEPEIAEILEGYLRRNGYHTERAGDGKTALNLFRSVQPDLILLDVMLPELDGIEVLRTVRATSTVPVIMLSARAEELDKLIGLELGADDYVTKPFSPREVLARVKTVLRRGSSLPAPEALLRVGALEVDPAKMSASVDGVRADLSATEFRLLYHLAQTPGRVFRREELLEAALPESDALERVVDSHFRNLRRKLGEIGGDDLIETVRGVGYRLAEPHG